jgi:hypothetical protein
METLGQKLLHMLHAIGQPDGIPNPDKSNIVGRFLFDIFVWQELERYSSMHHKRAWEEAVAEGIVPPDDTLRMFVGETIVRNSDHFAVRVNVQPPHSLFDLDEFVNRVARKWKLPKNKLRRLAEECKTNSKPILSKRVIEVRNET